MEPGRAKKFELLELDVWPDENGWRMARVAIDGVPSIPFQFHKSVQDQFRTDDELMAYLCRQGEAVIRRCGDGRNPYSEEMVN